MSPERWTTLSEILASALELGPADRPAFLDRECGDDNDLRSEVEALLASSSQATSGHDLWIDKPAVAGFAEELADVKEAAPQLQPGNRLGRYRILEKLGQGAMGTIHTAEDEQLGRTVALKIISDSNVGTVERSRFIREAKAASALNHPNIVTIYEYGSDNGVDFIAMEHIQGATLTQLLKDRAVPLPTALDWARQMASALSKAHKAGIVHRDLKPGNIMVRTDGIVKILDFGIATRKAAAGRPGTAGKEMTGTDLTMPGAIIGTPAYMSPEQARGEQVDYRSDIFSFGTILYELLCGSRPFQGDDTFSVLHAIVKEVPARPCDVNPAVSENLSELVGKCLEKDRGARLQDLDLAVSELSAVAMGTVERQQVRTVPPGKSIRWRKPRLAVWLPMAGLLVAAVGGLFFFQQTALRLLDPVAGKLNLSGSSYELTQTAREKLHRYDKPENLEAALQLLGKAITVNPQHAPAYAALAETYVRKNAISADATWKNLAAQYATKAVSLDPLLSYGHAALAMSLVDRGDRNQAAEEYRKAMELDPRSIAALVGLARVAASSGNNTKAEQLFEGALALAPSDWMPALEFALFRYRNSQFEEAGKLLEKARGLTPDNLAVRRNLAAVYVKLDRQDDAATEMQRALEIRPSPALYTNLGTIRFYQGRYLEALPLMEKAVELGAKRYVNWGNLADIYRLLPGYESKAKSAYAAAIQLAREATAAAPEDPEIRATLSVYLSRSGDFDATKKELRALEQMPRRTPGSLFKAAIAEELCGNRERSLEFLRRAVQDGYPMREIVVEPDLVRLREDSRYYILIASARADGGGTPGATK